jgi:uroporphyrinogen-III synthase
MALFSVSSLCSSPSPRLQLHRQQFFFLSQQITPSPSPVAASATDSNSNFTFTFASSSNHTPKVVVTRERGKNAKLITALVLTSTFPLLRFLLSTALHCVRFYCL